MQYSFLWLFVEFVYDTNHYDVLEVTNSYDSCNEKNFLMNVIEGEDSDFKLAEALQKIVTVDGHFETLKTMNSTEYLIIG